jgi:hypothetical protein
MADTDRDPKESPGGTGQTGEVTSGAISRRRLLGSAGVAVFTYGSARLAIFDTDSARALEGTLGSGTLGSGTLG